MELFTTGFWNRSLNDVFENDGIVLSQNKNFFYDDGVRKCPSIRVGNDQYGKSQPYFSIDQNGYSPGVNGSNASTGVIGKFGFKQSCSTSPLMMLRHKHPLALYVEDASIIKNKLIAAGVPLLFCAEDPKDQFRIDSFSTEWTDDESIKTYNCSLPDYPENKWQNSIKFKVVSNILVKFEVWVQMKKGDVNTVIGDDIHERLLNPAIYKELVLKHEIVRDSYRQGAEELWAESKQLDAEHAAYQRNIKAQSRGMFAEAFSESMAESRAQDREFDSIQSRAMQQIRSYQTARSSSKPQETPQYVRPKPSTTNSKNSANQGTKKLTTYEAEKQNCLNAGKKWNNGCDYSTTVEITGWTQGNRASVKEAPPAREPKARAETGSASSYGGYGHTNTTDVKEFGGYGNRSTDNGPRAWAFCWETKSGSFLCDGPLQRLLVGEKTLAGALSATDCDNGRDTRDGWYDCERQLKWTENHKERNVRSLRSQ
ncbi:MAG: hypothetical protein K6L80_16395 [Agarilytica sp.]